MINDWVSKSDKKSVTEWVSEWMRGWNWQNEQEKECVSKGLVIEGSSDPVIKGSSDQVIEQLSDQVIK